VIFSIVLQTLAKRKKKSPFEGGYRPGGLPGVNRTHHVRAGAITDVSRRTEVKKKWSPRFFGQGEKEHRPTSPIQ